MSTKRSDERLEGGQKAEKEPETAPAASLEATPGSASSAEREAPRGDDDPTMGKPARKLTLVRRMPPDGRVEITLHGRDLIRRGRAEGLSAGQLAHRLGIGAKTLRDSLQRDPEAQEAWDVGNAANESELTSLLMRSAREGNVTAAIYLTKARHGWREGDAPDQRPSITIVLPDSASPEAYLKQVAAMHRPAVIEHEPEQQQAEVVR